MLLSKKKLTVLALTAMTTFSLLAAGCGGEQDEILRCAGDNSGQENQRAGQTDPPRHGDIAPICPSRRVSLQPIRNRRPRLNESANASSLAVQYARVWTS